MSLPSDYSNEISALNREVLKTQPKDILQFCANFFQRRLESQRAEFLLSHRHSSQPGMAESNFPGSNPFTSTAPNPLAGTGGGMHSLAEEEEHDFASPTASSFPQNIREVSPSDPSTAPSAGGTFGNFGGFGASARGNNQAPSESNDSMAQSTFPNNYNMNRRTSVSAESLAPGAADDSNWKAPSYPKTQEQVARLREAVSHNFLFKNLDEDQASQVLSALQEKRVPAKDVRVITQGESGDYFYVVESGKFDIYISSSGKAEQGQAGLGDKVASSGPGTSFGELALMYNAPRAATVVSTEPSVLWQLDRLTFRKILMDSAFQRRRMYESFLEGVPLLSSLTPYERSKIADALDTVKHPTGSTIIQEGDVGDKFYILESGQAIAVKRGREGQPLKAYKPGDYFGELALLDDKPRAASVVTTTEVKVAALDKDGFQRLLGPVEAIMRRDDPRNSEGVDPLR
ncbi:Putative cAMP-dependent protein kinase regulatory subunit [Septoria linicola]|uniref:cAMP-dependent protein kinase regulatory subunit n=1 Tax=Septoria linicola TaxID=215465 RepID=A0A9Q9APV8_9PEZI|nr:putative cAMP-dependent protein kinase regulatory subunit [Septoria linicola]USW53269.1 Putative cAMP-dependent protein kinase regulatory subunit [Septoria linicola]